MAAGLAFEGRGFAGKHGFVHCGAAIEDRCVNREALARQDKNAVAYLDLRDRHNSLCAVNYASGCGWAQARERVERGQCAAFGANFKAFAQ